MERTISGMMGKGSVSHNTRAFTAKNVDKERSKDNVEFCNEDIRDVYHKLFDSALERYNAKQKRNDRKIIDYYEKIRCGKQEKLFYEAIFQIGNKDDMNAQGSNSQLAKEILCEFMEGFQERNPSLYVFSGHLHMDEQTPHLHIDFVPFVRNSTRGLDTRVSLKGALGELGFRGGTRGTTEWKQWMEAEKCELSKVAEIHGVQWKQLGTNNKHLSVLDYEKQERQKEVNELEQAITESRERLAEVCSQQSVAEHEKKQMLNDIEAIRQETLELSAENAFLKEQAGMLEADKEMLLSDNKKLDQKQKSLQQEINKMLHSKTLIERSIRAYDEDERWQLPEPGALMSAKSYRSKKAQPLVSNLKEIAKNLTLRCIQYEDREKKMASKNERSERQISHLVHKVEEQEMMIENLQEQASVLTYLERCLGREQILAMIEHAKAEERGARECRRTKRVFDMSL